MKRLSLSILLCDMLCSCAHSSQPKRTAMQPVVMTATAVDAAEVLPTLDKAPNDEWVCKNGVCTLTPEAKRKYGDTREPDAVPVATREEALKKLQAEMDTAIKLVHKGAKKPRRRKKPAPTCSCKQ